MKKQRLRQDAEDLQFLLLCIIVLVLFILLTGRDFRLQRLIVTDKNPALTAQINALKLYHTPILFIPYRAIKRSLLQSNPELENIEFQLSNPDRWTLSMIPEARTPVVLVKQGENLWRADRAGVLFPGQGADSNLPQIELQGPVSLIPGMSIPSPFFDIVLKLALSLDNRDLPPFSRMVLDSKGNCKFFTKERFWVRIGSWRNLGERLKLLQPILRAVRERKISISEIDLRNEKTPMIKTGTLK